MPVDPKRAKALDAAIKSIERQFGKGAVMRMGDAETPQIETYSTGSLGLDIALGIGGVPKGRVVEIYGPESSGKTTIALQCIAACQKAGGVAAFIDAEHALDIRSMPAKLGVDDRGTPRSPSPDCRRAGARNRRYPGALRRDRHVLVIDSVAALVPKAELEGEMGDSAARRCRRA